MKKLVTIVFSLCYTICVAQTIENRQEDCRKIAEYAAVKYTDSWIKHLGKDKDQDNYVKKFPNVENWTIDSTECFNEYFEWLSNRYNNWVGTYTTLTQIVRTRNTQNIDTLLYIPTQKYEKFLEPTRISIKNDIVNWQKIRKQEQELAEYKEQIRQQEILQDQKQRRVRTESNFPIMTLILIVAIIVAIVFIAKGGLRNYIIKTVIGSGRVNEKFGNSNNVANTVSNASNTDISRLESKVAGLEHQIKQLIQWAENYEQRNPTQNCVITNNMRQEQKTISTATSQPQPTAANQPQHTSANNVFYVQKMNDGRLSECSEAQAQYKIIASKSEVAKFEFCGKLEVAKANYSATFDGVCVTIGSLSRATKYTTEQQGEVERDGNQWKVTKKATVKFS